MHELSFAATVIKAAVQELAGLDKSVRPRRISLRLGELSGLNPDNMSFCLDIIKKDTPLADVEIEVTLVRARVSCAVCGLVESDGRFAQKCPKCSGPVSGVVGGDEMDVSLECDD
jgi:hydrogenase nickel incorporation protein HypA/HybF